MVSATRRVSGVVSYRLKIFFTYESTRIQVKCKIAPKVLNVTKFVVFVFYTNKNKAHSAPYLRG